MITTIHGARPDGTARRRLTEMANDTTLDRGTRQKAANMLLSANVPVSVSAAEVRMFTRRLVSDLEGKIHAER